MNTVSSLPAHRPARGGVLSLIDELVAREPTLARFGFLMLLLLIPGAIALGLDDRTVRDVDVWVKPMKFFAATGVFALTAAWFVGRLPTERRRAWPVRALIGVLIATATFENVYISLQAALGQASHYNVGDALHRTLYTLMAIAAVTMTATQAVLAWQLARHGDLPRGGAWRPAVLSGLVLTFVLGTLSGIPLGGLQPPAGMGVPVFGWHLAGDLRPAHFLGIHAHQLLPLAGLAIDAVAPRRARLGIAITIAAYLGLWVLLMMSGLAGGGTRVG
jgi:hypothetical protein